MIFGKSLFESVLTRIEEETPEPAPTQEPGHRIAGFTTAFVAPAFEGVGVSMARIGEAYLDLEPDAVLPDHGPQQAEEPPPLPEHLTRLDPREIEADLGLVPGDTVPILQEKRRIFARLNHPDIVHPAHAAAATQRMMMANRLVDEAARRAQAMASLGLS